ncbi:MAG: adenosylcobalamin-dependent ribonucleoside-diphosphate reductase [Phycisphaerales bacterium]|nr:adenosylcobalamin-dependent ribonucleoside-diphosphate reductase [Phycisphaerales bacterium]
MKITRKFTTAGQDVFSTVKWVNRSSKITNPDGSVVFKMDDASVPESWSQLATDIMVSKYFRKAGVPLSGPDGKIIVDDHGKAKTGPEKSARQVIHRLAGCWRHWGEKHNYFDSKDDAQAFYDELAYMLVHQVAAPNSPQWFNTGLNFAYGITGPAQGHFVCDAKTGAVSLADDAYSNPQPHACFIQSVEDDLVNEGGIMDLWVREARLFKYGSGTGTNFSGLRAENERLSGGGKSSGLMSWLKIGDRAAGAIKSGGTTRRAAKMVCLDMDHPDISTFVNWKVREEIKVQAMVEGLKVLKQHDPKAAAQCEAMDLKLDFDFNGEAYATVSGQNSNNSVRIPDEFFEAVDKGNAWQTRYRITGKPAKSFDARELWDQIAFAAWRCADPGVQYDSTINSWHTCPSAGRINASNPCSEYMFLDNTACNLASINLITLYDPQTRRFDVERYEHAIDLWTMVLEISVLMAAFPSQEIARLSYRYRTLGLGYANLGAMLMQAGLAYDSDEARALTGTLTAILTGRSYRMSAMMAKEHGPFAGYEADQDAMLRVIRNHRRAAMGVQRSSNEYEQLNIHTRPVPIDHALCKSGRLLVKNAPELLEHAVDSWDEALELGIKHGYRNAQTTVIAPTGTIGLLMDCDTTGIEPDFALVKFKKLAGGGYFKIANASVRPALEALGYTGEQIREMMFDLLGTLTVDVTVPGTTSNLKAALLKAGLNDEDVSKINEALPGAFELTFAFNAFALGEEALARLGVDADAVAADSSWNLLRHMGLSKAQIDGLNDIICGRQTLEGARHLKAEHLPVFDCANPCGKYGTRFIAPEGHIKAMAAAQPFITGAISKTINLPNNATVEDIKAAYRLSWELGLKANALYRDGCKMSQPLSTTMDAATNVGESKKESAELAAAGVDAAEQTVMQQVEEVVRIVERPMRRRLPDTRASITHKFNVAGHEGYLTVGLFEDGMPGELFITMAKEGSTIGGLMDALGTSTSIALQYGVPVEGLVNKFTHQRFEPAGMTTNSDIPFAKSLVDYIFRWMGMQFITGYREMNAPKRSVATGSTVEDAAVAAVARLSEPAPAAVRAETAVVGGIGHRHVHVETKTTRIDIDTTVSTSGMATTAHAQFTKAMEDAGDGPPCDVCGTITVRNGTCHKCLNCGNSLGCS